MMNAQLDDVFEDEFFGAINHRYGYDFGGYARTSRTRRLRWCLNKYKVTSAQELKALCLKDENFFRHVLNDLTLTVTEMFRDPEFYKGFRHHVIPYLKTFAEIKIWIAGCASGEEAYSIAIVLSEEDLLSRSLIYATDINTEALEKARRGIVATSAVQNAQSNYIASGGAESLSRYFYFRYYSAILDSTLRSSIFFSEHNLATDRAFGEMNLVICRNVLIYFERALKVRVFDVFRESLIRGGFLCLGAQENLIDEKFYFESIDKGQRIFQLKLRAQRLS